MKCFKKFIGILIAAGMILSMTACNGSDGNTNNSETTLTKNNEAVSSNEDIMKPFAPYKDTVTLTVARIMNRGAQLAPGETTSDNGLLDVIKKKLNVEWKIAWETPPAQYKQKLALSIAGGNVPDVFLIQGGSFETDNYLTFKALAKTGRLLI